MIRGIILILPILFSSIAYADAAASLDMTLDPMAGEHNPTNFSGKESPFDTITDWYGSAKSVTFSQRTGLYIGKCYHHTDKTKPFDTAVVIAERQLDDGGGPEFPPTTERKVGLLNILRRAPLSYYMSFVYELWPQLELNLQADSKLEYALENVAGEVRETPTKKYLVTLPTTRMEVDCTVEGMGPDCKSGKLPAGTQVWACYFYEKLTE